MKRLLLLNLLGVISSVAYCQVTNSFPDLGIPTIGGSNYMSISNRMFFQAKNQDMNGYNRGIVANNLYWDSAQTKWTNGTGASFDFAMMRFESGGNIGFFNGPVPDPNVRQTFTNSEMEAYRTLSLKSTGRVGIGTASPATYLSVYQSTSSGSYGTYPAIEVNNPNTSGGAVAAFVLRSGTASAAGVSGAIGSLQCNTADNTSQSTWLRSYAAAYPIYIGYNKTDLAISNGNVGIGTNTPTEKLAVDGTILAKKIKVSQAAADWPDYVFDKDYPLMSLDSVEAFVHLNHHLPEMASAEEVSKMGIDIGDNQKKLLQKTEEFMLYLIDQNRRLKAQVEISIKQDLQIAELKRLVAHQQQLIDAFLNKQSEENMIRE